MVAKVYRTPEAEPVDAELPVDPELEAEVAAAAAWFEAQPSEWQRYFDEEARRGREAYQALREAAPAQALREAALDPGHA